MDHTPSRVEVLDPVDRWLHLAAIVGFLGVLASGPLLQSPRLAAQLGVGKPALVAAHGACGGVLAALWSFHLVRVCLAWLEGRNPTGLLPRPSDAGDLMRTLARGAAAAALGRFSYRERLPYLFFLLALPALALGGWAVSHPAGTVGLLGGSGLLLAADLHRALGLLCVPALVWHLYFAQVQPGVLYWNPAWLTGRAPWAQVQAVRPAWAASLVREFQPAEDGEAEGLSVEALLAAGNAAGRRGAFEEAAGCFRQAVELYPGYGQGWFNLGVVLARSGDGAGARRALEEFLRQDPFGPMATKAQQLLAKLEES
ncbi:MAG: tetratricopeptide repeat protein [Deferrisomatales bacterium]|nr:tetratricopeptide repeat protein [Deferrisomatales bacterium]